MRRVPTGRSTTSPAPFSTLRCCDTAGRLTGSSRAIAPTGRGCSPSSSKIARLVESPRAVNASAWLADTNRKLALTAYARQARAGWRLAELFEPRADAPLARRQLAVEPLE